MIFFMWYKYDIWWFCALHLYNKRPWEADLRPMCDFCPQKRKWSCFSHPWMPLPESCFRNDVMLIKSTSFSKVTRAKDVIQMHTLFIIAAMLPPGVHIYYSTSKDRAHQTALSFAIKCNLWFYFSSCQCLRSDSDSHTVLCWKISNIQRISRFAMLTATAVCMWECFKEGVLTWPAPASNLHLWNGRLILVPDERERLW